MKGTNKKTCKNIKGSLKLTTLGFTLVELLAVIVILAIILVIAVPKVMSVIEDSKKATLESTAKMIASSAEKQKVQNTVLGNTNAITCDSVAKINKGDYASCSIEFENNTAKVTIEGSGKFEGLWVCGGTKTSASATKDECSLVCDASEKAIERVEYEVKDYDSCVSYLRPLIVDTFGNSEEDLVSLCKGDITWYYTFSQNIQDMIYYGDFTQEELIENNVVKVKNEKKCIKEAAAECFEYIEEITYEVKDYDSCISYTKEIFTGEDNFGYTDEEHQTFCRGEVFQEEDFSYYIHYMINYKGFTEEELLENNVIVKKYNLGISDYDIACGTDVVVPSQINGKNVFAILSNSFKSSGITSVYLPNTIEYIGYEAFRHNHISGIEIPSSVTDIETRAFENNPLINVKINNLDAEIDCEAFGDKSTITTHNLPDDYESYCEVN